MNRFELLKSMDRERAREAALMYQLEAQGKVAQAAPHRARAMELAKEIGKITRTLKSTEPGGYLWKKANA